MTIRKWFMNKGNVFIWFIDLVCSWSKVSQVVEFIQKNHTEWMIKA